MSSERSRRETAAGLPGEEGAGAGAPGGRGPSHEGPSQGHSGAGVAPASGARQTQHTVEKRAGPVALQPAACRKGYRLRGGERYERESDGEAVESVLVAYGGSPARFGLFATPVVEGAERRGHVDAAAAGPAEFLYTPAGRRLLGTLGVVDEDFAWPREYELFDANPGEATPRLLGEVAEMVSLVGRTDDDTVVLAHVARVVHDGDVVFAVDARGRPLGDHELLVGEGVDAVYPRPAQAAWGDWFVGVCGDVARVEHEPFSPGVASVAIAHPPSGEALTDPGGRLSVSGRVVETGVEDRPFARLHPRMRATGDFDRLTWAVRRRHPDADPGEWVEAGRGECTHLRLTDQRCGPTTYDVRVSARDASGTTLTSAVRTVTVDLWGC